MTHTSKDPAPAAASCKLSADALTTRVGEWRSLAGTALRRRVEPGRVITVFPNRADVARAVTRLAAAEAECCPFLEFDVREDGSELRVELRYPREFTETLAGFLAGVGAPLSSPA